MKTTGRLVWCRMKAWRSSPRVWAAFLLGIGLGLKNLYGFLSFANGTGYSVQAFEAYILLGCRVGNFLGILVGCLLLVADAPFVSQMSGCEAVRAGRKKWVAGQMLYTPLACGLYSLAMLAAAAAASVLVSGAFWENRRGEAMTMLAVKQPDFALRRFYLSFPFPELLSHTTPAGAAALTLIFNTAYMTLAGWCILLVNLLTNRNLGWIAGACLHILNYIIYANGGALLPLRFSLLCCASPAYHYTEGFGMSPLYPLAALGLPLACLAAAGLKAARRVEFY